ncbi:hypothetical protein [Actinomadura opuntiae]|uniref:hypothetical protein n=1 Tax=Actinomadura sp. OS1-43 TaxID=604315 RepID=UPI00255AAAF2|nr:hypothetical protein [Actinomadura sp. OS1-43]MDL4817749.1 hypothetical protein [Actinomadura sp. OS1-43]
MRNAFLSALRPLVTCYLKQKTEAHMEDSFVSILNLEERTARHHWDMAEVLRATVSVLSHTEHDQPSDTTTKEPMR